MIKSKTVNLYPKPNGTKADQLLSVAGSAVQLVTTTWDITTYYIVLDVQGADIRCTFDGSAPTSSNGHVLKKDTSYTWSTQTARAAKFISADGATQAYIMASQFTD